MANELEDAERMLALAQRISERDFKQVREGGKVQRLWREEIPLAVQALQLAAWFLKMKMGEHP